jgi:hypothetical protein
LLEFADDVDVSHTLLLLDDEELDKFWNWFIAVKLGNCAAATAAAAAVLTLTAAAFQCKKEVKSEEPPVFPFKSFKKQKYKISFMIKWNINIE